jgi:hypothetical protein
MHAQRAGVLALALCLASRLAVAEEAIAPAQPAAPIAAPADARIRVAKIRFEIGEYLCEWTEEAFPEDGPTGTTAATVASFLDFAPGTVLTENELGSRCRASRLRLLDSGFFFDAQITVIPPSRYPERRTVLVSVREGFTWRFGGGDGFALVGQDNAAGRRRSWRLILGWKADAASWRDELCLGLPLVLGAEAGWASEGQEDFVATRRFFGSAEIGYRPHPELTVFAEGSAALYEYSGGSALATFPGSAEALESGPLFGVEAGMASRSKRENGALKSRLETDNRAGASFLDGLSYARARGQAVLALGAGRFEAALLGAYGLNAGALFGSSFGAGNPPFPLLFDLCATPDRSVRSGYDHAELVADAFALGSLELRWNALSVPFSQLIVMGVSPFAFVDLARTTRGDSKGTFEALGAGIRVGLDNPVFAFFTFAYGWNPSGSGRFSMTGSAGF